MAGVTTITDLRDMEGDKIHGIKTLPIVLGPSKTVKIALLEIGFVGTFPFLFYSHIGFTVLYPMFTMLVLIFSVLSLYPLIYQWEKRDLCIKVKRKLVFLFLLYQTGLMSGAAPLNSITVIFSVAFSTTLILFKVLRS
jgi:4-hydroxybenzoate polyprenyltransferase